MADEKILGADEKDGAGEDGGELNNDTILTGDEEKPAEEAKDEEKKDEAADTDDGPKDGAADEGKPVEYQDFNVPEGVELDKAALAEFIPIVTELGVSQEGAQKLVDLQLKFSQEAVDAQTKQWADIQGQWKETAENDPEYGKGAYDASVLTARKAMREIGTPELLKALEDTGMGNHPEFIRFFYRVGKLVGEDTIKLGGADQAPAKTHADRLFPNQGKK
tara:strand:+ start:346 stop:1005 length:660 start_codon:yes stop_codon:yes gene_type:complete